MNILTPYRDSLSKLSNLSSLCGSRILAKWSTCATSTSSSASSLNKPNSRWAFTFDRGEIYLLQITTMRVNLPGGELLHITYEQIKHKHDTTYRRPEHNKVKPNLENSSVLHLLVLLRPILYSILSNVMNTFFYLASPIFVTLKKEDCQFLLCSTLNGRFWSLGGQPHWGCNQGRQRSLGRAFWHPPVSGYWGCHTNYRAAPSDRCNCTLLHSAKTIYKNTYHVTFCF